MCTATIPGRRQRIRNFINMLLEAHIDPDSSRPTLGDLAGCLTDDEIAGLPCDERLAVEPSPYQVHPAGNLRRGHGVDIWAHLPGSPCYLHIPDGLAVHYKFEVAGAYTALALQAMPPPGLGLSEDFSEFPVSRLIMDPSLVVVLVADHSNHRDVEIAVP